jgi:hypothetical protein
VTGKDKQIGVERFSGKLSALTGLAGEIVIEIIDQKSDVKSFSIHLSYLTDKGQAVNAANKKSL